MGVNPNTVAKAYRDLQLMSWVSARRNMGIFVTRGCEKRCRDDVRHRLTQQLFQAVTEAKAAGMSQDEIMKLVKETFGSS